MEFIILDVNGIHKVMSSGITGERQKAPRRHRFWWLTDSQC